MADKNVLSEKEIKLLEDFIKSVRYGSVNIVIQDGKIVQIEKHEKIRVT